MTKRGGVARRIGVENPNLRKARFGSISCQPYDKCDAEVATKLPLGTFWLAGMKKEKPRKPLLVQGFKMVGVTGVEPVTSCM